MELSTEMFNIYNSMKENAKLTSKNVELRKRNEVPKLKFMNIDALKDEIKYFKNKLMCADKIERFLRT